jgi:general secretion pathway protein A
MPAAAAARSPDGVAVERLAFLQAVQQASPGQSAYDATEALLRVWRVDPLSASEAAGDSLDLTEIARRRGLRYLALQGNLNTLRVLDLPAILEVAPDDGSPARFVTLEQLIDTTARVAVGREPLEMQPLVLAEAWFGKAHLFWQDLDRLGPFLAVGNSSDAVARLHERLRAARFYDGDASQMFAPETEQAVLRFQQRERLVADGKVGPMTMIALYRRTSAEGLPHLGGVPTSTGIAAADDRGSAEDQWVGTLEGQGP